MHWLLVTAEWAGAVAAIITFIGLVRGKIVRPLILGWQTLERLLEQIRDASGGVQKLAREVEGLAGAIANFVVRIQEQVDDHAERLERLEERTELVVDLQADVERLQRSHREENTT